MIEISNKELISRGKQEIIELLNTDKLREAAYLLVLLVLLKMKGDKEK